MLVRLQKYFLQVAKSQFLWLKINFIADGKLAAHSFECSLTDTNDVGACWIVDIGAVHRINSVSITSSSIYSCKSMY